MIATILPGSTNFHAVGYNERKVAKGTARLLEMKNFGALGTFGKPTPDELVSYLMEYTSRNDRIQKAQFHISFSCKGHEMSEAEVLEFAHQYLKEMGYMEEGQPLLAYSHYDTDNTHVHIVTSRIAPDGRKIEHDNERRRSQEVIDRIIGNDRKQKTRESVEAAKEYTFSSFAQFKSVMLSLGYETYLKDDTVFIKHGGKVQQKIPFAEIAALYKPGNRDRNRCRQLRSILKKYRDVSANKEELQKELKSKFGIDIVFFGRKDSHYGYMIVDHHNKTVINGARVLAIDQLLDFATPEQRFNRIEDFIDKLFSLNPKITQAEIHEKLRKQHAYIKKGVIYFHGETRPLKPYMAEAIDRNNRIAWVEMFQPTNEQERALLCKFYKVDSPELVTLQPKKNQSYANTVNRLHEIFDDESITYVRGKLKEEGFIIRQEEDATYAINFHKHILVNLSEEGFDLNRLKPQQQSKRQQQQQPKPTNNHASHLVKLRDSKDGSRSEKREWEVGQKNGYGEVDDGRSLKR